MSTPTMHQAVAAVREIVVPAGPSTLSGLISESVNGPPRALVLALPGNGLRASYFHGPADPSVSLLTLGAGSGYTVVALDRPGYGLSATQLPQGLDLAGQVALLRAALFHLTARYSSGAGIFLLGHSFGGMLALAMAADLGTDPAGPLLGTDISGTGAQYGPGVDQPAAMSARTIRSLRWGPPGLYPPGTFRLAGPLTAAVPDRENRETTNWPELFGSIAERIRMPVRFTFAEHERWWQHDEGAMTVITDLLTSARVSFARQPRAGHNLSLGWAARSYHLRALGFLEECLVERELRTR